MSFCLHTVLLQFLGIVGVFSMNFAQFVIRIIVSFSIWELLLWTSGMLYLLLNVDTPFWRDVMKSFRESLIVHSTRDSLVGSTKLDDHI